MYYIIKRDSSKNIYLCTDTDINHVHIIQILHKADIDHLWGIGRVVRRAEVEGEVIWQGNDKEEMLKTACIESI